MDIKDRTKTFCNRYKKDNFYKKDVINIAQSFKLIGLGLNFLGGFILWKNPFMYFSDGEAYVAPPEEMAKRRKMTKIGMGFMTIGFLFQFIGNLF